MCLLGIHAWFDFVLLFHRYVWETGCLPVCLATCMPYVLTWGWFMWPYTWSFSAGWSMTSSSVIRWIWQSYLFDCPSVVFLFDVTDSDSENGFVVNSYLPVFMSLFPVTPFFYTMPWSRHTFAYFSHSFTQIQTDTTLLFHTSLMWHMNKPHILRS